MSAQYADSKEHYPRKVPPTGAKKCDCTMDREGGCHDCQYFSLAARPSCHDEQHRC